MYAATYETFAESRRSDRMNYGLIGVQGLGVSARDILHKAEVLSASDIHLSTGSGARFRVDGELVFDGGEVVTEAVCLSFLEEIAPGVVSQIRAGAAENDFAFDGERGVRYRGHVYRQAHGVSISLRRLPSRNSSLSDLGIPAILSRIVSADRGLLLITGATGSGKSTTAAALIDFINQNYARHIVTIEDPIEFAHRSNRSLVSQREVGAHTDSFSRALRAALREDPDVIFVGEMRDAETIHMALTAAETGHLVISTLHTSGAARTIDRIVDVFPSSQQNQARAMVAESLLAVISQDLVSRVGGGRIVVPEVLIGAPAVRALIREGKIHQLEHVMQTSGGMGMQTRTAALRQLRERGLVPKEEE